MDGSEHGLPGEDGSRVDVERAFHQLPGGDAGVRVGFGDFGVEGVGRAVVRPVQLQARVVQRLVGGKVGGQGGGGLATEERARLRGQTGEIKAVETDIPESVEMENDSTAV